MKKTDFNYNIFLTLFVLSIVIANVVGARVITTGIEINGILLATSGGAITYAVTFLCTDVVGELWGKERSVRLVKCGIIGQVFALIAIYLTGIVPAVDAGMDEAYKTLLSQSWVFVLGSLCAYYLSQTWDVWVFHTIRRKVIDKCDTYHGQMRWLWNNVSTMTSQIIDTAVYCIISFGLGMGMLFSEEGRHVMLGIMLGQYILKFCLALIDTPFFYALTRKREE